MKVCLNAKLIDGPYGGGANFVRDLYSYLHKKKIIVVFDLQDNDVDIILNINFFPFLNIKAAAFSHWDVYLYKLKHPKCRIVTQINECDERKHTHYVNKLIIQAANKSDHIIYIATWLKKIFSKQGLNPQIPSTVILHGVDRTIFNHKQKQPWRQKGPLKIVTHHWSPNYYKGHDIYQMLDQLLAIPKYQKLFQFTYIGNISPAYQYVHTTVIAPLSGAPLARELKKHHIYLTASRNEPAGMHHIEGACCGLPLLFINSGALPEYCKGFGISFKPHNFSYKLMQMRRDYSFWYNKVLDYNRSASQMCSQYLKLFEHIYRTANQVVNPNPNLLKILAYTIYSKMIESLWKIKQHFNLIN